MVSNGESNVRTVGRFGNGKRNLILLLTLLTVFCLFYVLGPLTKSTRIYSTFIKPVFGQGDIFMYDHGNLSEILKTASTRTKQRVNGIINKNNVHTGKIIPAVKIPTMSQLTTWNNTMLYKIWQEPSTKGIPNVFKPMLNSAEVELYAQTLRDFVSNITAAGLNYFMYGGTLIGSFRHHGLIPWDDDIDIIVPSAKKDQLLVLLKKLKPAYDFIASGPRWKFYSTKAKPVKNVKHKWPFLDVCFYGMDNHTVWDADPGYRYTYSYPRDMVFPLVKRPFWNLWLNAPRDTYGFLMHTYDITQCQSARYHHKTETWASPTTKKTLSCKVLHNAFPFVFHQKKNAHSTTEVLKRGENIIQVLNVPS